MADDLPDAPWAAQSDLPDAPWAKPSGGDFSWSRAITDIPHEIGQEAGSALTDIGNLSNRSEQGPVEGLTTTGKAALAVPRLLASPITGAARSLIGHPMANLEHKVGEYINPEVAAKDNPEQMYETAKGDVDTAMSAVRPVGAPIKVPGTSVTTAHPTVPGAQVTTTPRGTYEWKGPQQAPKPTGVVKQPETEAFFDSADNHYSNMRGFGVEIDPRAMNGVADNIINELYAEGYRPRNSKVFDDVEELRKPAGQNHEISDIDSVRKVLRRTSLDPSERDAARRAIGHIDDYLANLKNNPQDVVVNPHFADRVSQEAVAARGDYAVAKRSEDVDEAMDKAQRQAASGGAGGNINNATRQQLKSLRNNKKKMIGWTDDEKAELDAVINGSTVANATRQAGKFAPHGIVSTVMSAGAGHALAPGFGEVAVPAAGWIAKKIGDRLTQKAAERLSDVVKARSPLGKQTSINTAAQSALAPSSSNPRLLSTGVAAALPHRLPAINIRPLLSAEDNNQNQNPTAGFARGGNVNHAHSSGEDHSGRAAAEKALPANHKLGMKVPKGGSNCAKCRFLSSKTTCGNRGFVKWNGGAKLPAPADQYCCDLYEKAKGFAIGGPVVRAMDSGGATDFDTEWQDRAWPTYPETMHQMQRTKPDLYKALNSEASARREEETPRSFNDRFRPIHQMDIYNAGGAVNRAVRAAKGFADGGAPDDSYDPFAAEKFVNPEVSQAVGNLTQTSRPAPDPNDPVLYRTASPLVNITQGDIERGMNVAMSTGPSAIAGAPKFYSALDQAVESLPLNKATGQQWLGTLTNKGVKGEEMEHRGVADFLAENANRPVTKEEVQNHLAGNKVELGEVEKGGNYNIENIRRLEAEREQVRNDLNEARRNNRNLTGPEREANIARMKQLGDRDEEIGHEIYSSPNTPDPTKFSSYQLPGGENYREKLLTLPTKEVKATAPGDIASEMQAAQSERAQNYTSSHWDEPNVLVHRRTNEREVMGPYPDNGPKDSLHIEEIQSDWHQQGRQRGYLDPAVQKSQAQFTDFVKQLESKYGTGNDLWKNISEEDLDKFTTLQKANENSSTSLPDAPFKKNWHELALKDAIREAAEKGFNRISWTPGEAQAARYDLSKQINKLSYNPKQQYLKAWDHNGNEVITKEGVKPEHLPDLVGKEAAEKLVNTKPQDFKTIPSVKRDVLTVQQSEHQYHVRTPDGRQVNIGKGTVESEPAALEYAERYFNNDAFKINNNRELEYGRLGPTHILEGQDLKVGGEGMKGFYDKMIPDAMNKIGKPHGVKVQKGTTPSAKRELMDEDLEGLEAEDPEQQAIINAHTKSTPQDAPVWYMDIPESLKKEALHKGFKMFADGGAVTLPKPTKTGGRISYPAALKTAYAIKRASQ